MSLESPEIVYVTDVEGRWDKLESALSSHGSRARVRMTGGRIDVAEGALLVFGGDATDRGPSGRRIVATLLDAKERHPDRVILLAGNRDLNKLRLRVELAGRPPARAPEEIARASRGDLLRWIFAHTMGARDAFAMRAAELAVCEGGERGERGALHDDEEVVESFVADVGPDGLLVRYLAQCQLAFRSSETLFVHGAVTGESLGFVPGSQPTRPPRVDAWIAALNGWYTRQVDAYRSSRGPDSSPYELLVAYQAPIPGTRLHQASVVYGRLADAHNNPHLPSMDVIGHLQRDGIQRLVVGHTPTGDAPVLLRADGAERFELVCADNSYGRLEWGARVTVRGRSLSIEARAELDTGEREQLGVEVSLDDDVAPLGSRDVASGHLVGSRLERGGYYLYRANAGFTASQVATDDASLAGCRLGPASGPFDSS